jgi:hypothetical protein
MARRVPAVGHLRREELRAVTTARWWRAAMLLVPVAIGALAVALVPDVNPVAAFLLAAAAAALAGALATYLLADSRAKSAFVQGWASSRGWTADTGSWRDEATPLLRDGDRRESKNHVSGPLAGDSLATLCHYTFEVRHEHTSSNGDTTTSWEEHDFTVVEAAVAAPGVPRLSLHPRSFGDNSLFDRIDSVLTSDRVVQLESAELDREYKLEVADGASDLALRLLFEPAFIVWCLDQAEARMLVEIEGDTLVVAIPDHSYDPAQLDDLVARAATVAGRLADTRMTAGMVT